MKVKSFNMGNNNFVKFVLNTPIHGIVHVLAKNLVVTNLTPGAKTCYQPRLEQLGR